MREDQIQQLVDAERLLEETSILDDDREIAYVIVAEFMPDIREKNIDMTVYLQTARGFITFQHQWPICLFFDDISKGLRMVTSHLKYRVLNTLGERPAPRNSDHD